ncbi:MAG: tetratricopeptide repeat protein [Candidatus Latescibacteria bacterium]|nr:tetratricopeptide repeat protein [Candidatus Latescibacterota bacterium]
MLPAHRLGRFTPVGLPQNPNDLFDAVDFPLHEYPSVDLKKYSHPKWRKFEGSCQLLRQLPHRAPALIEKGQAPQVEAWCRLVLAQNPGYQEGMFFLAVALFAQGRYAESITLNQQLVALHPDFGEGHLQLANALESGGRSVEAVPVYRDLAVRGGDPSLRAEANMRLQNLERRLGRP